jgi:hypothetical protein
MKSFARVAVPDRCPALGVYPGSGRVGRVRRQAAAGRDDDCSAPGAASPRSATPGGTAVLVPNAGGSSLGGARAEGEVWDQTGVPGLAADILNVANAGRNIPLKWRLLTESGTPITNLASASVSAANINCETGTASDVVEEFASSASALINHGDGHYQLNWKTDKNWTGCKVMRLNLAGEAPITHDALFKFK